MLGEYSTIKDYEKAYEMEDITHRKLFFHNVLKSQDGTLYQVNEDSILNDFKPILDELKIEYSMTDEEFRKFQYNPKAFSYYLYGTTEFWHLLLDANEMYSATEFNRREIYVYSSSLRDTISTIIKTSKEYIDENDAEVTSALLSQ